MKGDLLFLSKSVFINLPDRSFEALNTANQSLGSEREQSEITFHSFLDKFARNEFLKNSQDVEYPLQNSRHL